MNRLFGHLVLVLILGAVCSNANSAAATEEYQRALCGYLTLDKDWHISRFGAKAIQSIFPSDTSLLDLVAEKLSTINSTEEKVDGNKAIEVYVLLLSADSTGRYQPLLNDLEHHYKDNNDLKALFDRSHTSNIHSTTSFTPGHLDLEKLRNSFLHTLLQDRKSDRSQFAFNANFKTMDDVLGKLGAPDFISVWKVHSPKLEYHYKDLGIFVFSLDNKNKMQWNVTLTESELFQVSSVYTGENFNIAQNLACIQGRRLKMYTKGNKKLYRDIQLVSVIVHRAASVDHFTDAYERSVAERALSIVARSNDPAAEAALKHAAQGKIAKYAKAASQALEHHKKMAADGKLVRTPEATDTQMEDDKDDQDDAEEPAK